MVQEPAGAKRGRNRVCSWLAGGVPVLLRIVFYFLLARGGVSLLFAAVVFSLGGGIGVVACNVVLVLSVVVGYWRREIYL